MKYRILPVTPFQQNATLLWCEATLNAVLVDPGGEADHLLAAVQQEDLILQRVLLTHGHLDHVGAAAEIAAKADVPIDGPQEADAFWLEALPQQAEMFGFPPVQPFLPDRWLADGDSVQVGESLLEVLHCPGHTPGHIVFFSPETRLAQVGDVLFHGSIGRTDFPRGDHGQLIASIRNRLLPLGDDVAFIPGHGPMSTFGEERRNNPFL